MKTKRENKSFSTLSIRFDAEEQKIVYALKDRHGINICGLIKILLKQKLEQLDKNVNLNL